MTGYVPEINTDIIRKPPDISTKKITNISLILKFLEILLIENIQIFLEKFPDITIFSKIINSDISKKNH